MSDNFQDCIEVQISMTKGDGSFPDVSDLSAAKIKKALQLSVDIETLKTFGFTHYRVMKSTSGTKSDSIAICDGEIEGYPRLTVRLYAPYNDTVGLKFDDSKIEIGSCFSYKLEIIGRNEDDPFYFEDHNGYIEMRREGRDIKSPEEFKAKIAPKCTAL